LPNAALIKNVSLREVLQLAPSYHTDKYQSQILSIISNGNHGYNVNTDIVKGSTQVQKRNRVSRNTNDLYLQDNNYWETSAAYWISGDCFYVK